MKKPTPLEPRPHPPDQPIRRCLCFAPRRPVRSLHNSSQRGREQTKANHNIYYSSAKPNRSRGRRPKTIYSFLKQNKTKPRQTRHRLPPPSLHLSLPRLRLPQPLLLSSPALPERRARAAGVRNSHPSHAGSNRRRG
jgi:hypothetical protein